MMEYKLSIITGYPSLMIVSTKTDDEIAQFNSLLTNVYSSILLTNDS